LPPERDLPDERDLPEELDLTAERDLDLVPMALTESSPVNTWPSMEATASG
jgi:hypothetical protein